MADAGKFNVAGDPLSNPDYGERERAIREKDEAAAAEPASIAPEPEWQPFPPSPTVPGEMSPSGVWNTGPQETPSPPAAPDADVLAAMAAAHGHGSSGVVGKDMAQSVMDALAAAGLKVVRA